MLLQSLRRSLFHVSLFTFCLSLIAPSAANAISFSRNFSWVGGSGSSVTGTFTGEDNNTDNIITVVSGGINEFTILNVTLTDTAGTAIPYTIGQLIGFSNLNFNFDTISGTILQSLDFDQLLQGTPGNYTAGLSIGDSTSGFALESLSGGSLQFSDNVTGLNNDNDPATLVATPVPFEFEGSAGMLVVGGIFGLRHWYKKRKLSNK